MDFSEIVRAVVEQEPELPPWVKWSLCIELLHVAMAITCAELKNEFLIMFDFRIFW